MLAMLESRLEKNRATQRKVPCLLAPCGSQYDVQSISQRRSSNAIGVPDEASTPSATRAAISALVKRMGVQVSYWRRRWHWLPVAFPLGVAFKIS